MCQLEWKVQLGPQARILVDKTPLVGNWTDVGSLFRRFVRAARERREEIAHFSIFLFLTKEPKKLQNVLPFREPNPGPASNQPIALPTRIDTPLFVRKNKHLDVSKYILHVYTLYTTYTPSNKHT